MSDSYSFNKRVKNRVTKSAQPVNGNDGNALTPDAPAQIELLGENEIAIVKNGKRHLFACPPGEEADLLNQIALMVSEPKSELTWFDAAVLSHQLGERMSKRLKDLAQRRRSA